MQFTFINNTVDGKNESVANATMNVVSYQTQTNDDSIDFTSQLTLMLSITVSGYIPCRWDSYSSWCV